MTQPSRTPAEIEGQDRLESLEKNLIALQQNHAQEKKRMEQELEMRDNQIEKLLIDLNQMKESNKQLNDQLNRLLRNSSGSKQSQSNVVTHSGSFMPNFNNTIERDRLSDFSISDSDDDWNPESCCKTNEELSTSSNIKRVSENDTALQKLYCCDQCSFKSDVKITLKTHKQWKYSNERSYQCDDCDKAFKTSGCLTRHRRIHNGEK